MIFKEMQHVALYLLTNPELYVIILWKYGSLKAAFCLQSLINKVFVLPWEFYCQLIFFVLNFSGKFYFDYLVIVLFCLLGNLKLCFNRIFPFSRHKLL